jgi:hypothetical protein
MYITIITFTRCVYLGFRKSSEISSGFREAGNTAYKALDVSNAFRGYNLALSFAPNETEQLGLVYANRAALFLLINEPHHALNDMYMALKYEKYDEQVYEKLRERKSKCERLIRDKQQHETEDCTQFLFGKNDECRSFCEEKFLHLESPSDKLRGAEDFVQVVYSPEYGRRLIVTKDVPAGTCHSIMILVFLISV